MAIRPLTTASRKCSDTQCVALQVDETIYKTAHTDGCVDSKSCPFVPVDVNKFASIIRRGDIPLIRVVTTQEATELKIHSSSSGASYIAISHVWAHGLGNVNENALPRCQVIRLGQLVPTLSRIIGCNNAALLWIDTLCIPVDASLYECRKLAIQKLTETFSNVTKVLVLDVEFRKPHFVVVALNWRRVSSVQDGCADYGLSRRPL